MRVLCCLDGTNIEALSKAITTMLRPDTLAIGLLYVIDSGPHGEIERQRERFLRQVELAPGRHGQLREAEEASAQDILEEGSRYFAGAERLQRRGRPEREIVNCAVEWNADLILLCPRTTYGSKPTIGPKSVGRVARFVLDHAACPVLLVRPITREPFPIPR